MSIGDKIRSRREVLGMTQEELANKMGYKSKTTINKIELGINDITQSRVIEFARALETTPSYLMGWLDEEEHNISFDTITKNNKKAIAIGNRIKDIRLKLDMNQSDFADKLGISKSTLHKYETGLSSSIPTEKIELIAKLGEVPASTIMGWGEHFEDKGQYITIESVMNKIRHISNEVNTVLASLDNLDSEILPIAKKMRNLSSAQRQQVSDYVDFLLQTINKVDIDNKEG